jgi:protein SCO1/2
MIRHRRLFLLLPLGLLACGEKKAGLRNTDIRSSQIGGEWNLHDFHGRPQNPGNFEGKVIILFFGYTRCPDICPTALAKYATLLKEEKFPVNSVQVLFVTLDPARDTPERLSEYLRWFHPAILGLTGDEQQIAEISRKYRVSRHKKEIPGSMSYVIDHSAGAYVFDPLGQLRLYLAENARPEDIVADVQQLLAGK